jgi:hypothetical protein
VVVWYAGFHWREEGGEGAAFASYDLDTRSLVKEANFSFYISDLVVYGKEWIRSFSYGGMVAVGYALTITNLAYDECELSYSFSSPYSFLVALSSSLFHMKRVLLHKI